jgi:outer membrane protein assembly factor BamE
MKRLIALALPVFAALTVLGGCSSAPEITSVLTPYRMDVRQGNFVTKEMSLQLKPGQTKDQVRFILGTPLINDLFHGDRWDYVYLFKPGHGEPQQRSLSVYFAAGKLLRVAGDVVADESLAAKDKANRPATGVIEINPETPEPEAAEKAKSMRLEPMMTMPGSN